MKVRASVKKISPDDNIVPSAVKAESTLSLSTRLSSHQGTKQRQG